MTKYVIYTDDFEFRFGTYRESIPAASADQIWQWYLEESATDPRAVAEYDSRSEAEQRFACDYGESWPSTYDQASLLFWHLRGEVAYLVEEEWDEDGECIQCGDILRYSAAAYEKDEDDD